MGTGRRRRPGRGLCPGSVGARLLEEGAVCPLEEERKTAPARSASHAEIFRNTLVFRSCSFDLAYTSLALGRANMTAGDVGKGRWRKLDTRSVVTLCSP